MNKTTIKSFAIRARQQLLEAARQRACASGDSACQRLLAEEIRLRGYASVMEEGACLWFSRFIALRFMEVNGFLPVRVFTDAAGEFKPQLLKEAMHLQLDGLDRERVRFLSHNDEALYRYLLITLCNALEKSLPHMFRRLPGWVEHLLPETLLKPDSILGQLVTEIPEEAFLDQVQVLGWLYQHYNSELKAEIFAQRKQNIKITRERIPAATQLFTPEWIVRYLVENSLGRIYIHDELSRHPEPLTEAQRVYREQQLASEMGWHYYLPEAEQTPEAHRQLSNLKESMDVTALKLIDPCMGCGHILVYAFDVLMQIYKARGWTERDAARSIVENNLYGLDIDDRAGQLSYFAVMMKAGKYDPDLLNGEVRPHVYAMGDSGFMTDELIAAVASDHSAALDDLKRLRAAFQNAGEYGSLLDVPPLDYAQLYNRIRGQTKEEQQLLSLIAQAQLLSQEYAVVVTNPPYMGAGSMSEKLSDFVKKHYPHSKSDLFAVFMERCTHMLAPHGYQAMITQHAWMFLGSFENLRKKLLTYDLVNMAHLGPRAFGQIPGAVVQTVSFVLRNTHTGLYRGTYCRLTAPVNQLGKEKLFLSGACRYYAQQSDFSKIPGSPVAYWLSRDMLEVFATGKTVGSIAQPKQGIATANNSRYLRLWHECRKEDIFFDCKSHEMSAADSRKWYPYNKGGQSRKWYGNHDYVINWQRDGMELCADPKAVIRNPQFFFKSSVSWSLVSPGIPAFRFKPEGQLFDVAGMCCFSDDHLYDLLALFNSKVAFEMLKVLAPTINYQCGDIANIPVKPDHNRRKTVEQLSRSNVALCKEDWDSFEESWEFKKHPLI